MKTSRNRRATEVSTPSDGNIQNLTILQGQIPHQRPAAVRLAVRLGPPCLECPSQTSHCLKRTVTWFSLRTPNKRHEGIGLLSPLSAAELPQGERVFTRSHTQICFAVLHRSLHRVCEVAFAV